jgi:hypothetical protein
VPRRRKPQRATPKPGTQSPETGAEPPREEVSPTRSVEEGWDLWVRYARETGDAITEFLRRFGEERQKNYEAWAANVSETVRPKGRLGDLEEARTRFGDWNRQAEAIGSQVREAFERSLKPQRDLLELWAKPFLPAEATPADRVREIGELAQNLWSGLARDLTQRWLEALEPGQGLDEFVRTQDEMTKKFTENFQKLTRAYFTSPAFVAAFGRTLSTSLDLQKSWNDSEELFRRVTGLPTRREIGELNLAVRELSEQVSRLNGKRT